MDRRKAGFLVVTAGLFGLAAAMPHPQADIRILAHEKSDLAPRTMRAAVDLGLVGVSVLVTWTAERLAN
jgi:hypothetical protein